MSQKDTDRKDETYDPSSMTLSFLSAGDRKAKDEQDEETNDETPDDREYDPDDEPDDGVFDPIEL